MTAGILTGAKLKKRINIKFN